MPADRDTAPIAQLLLQRARWFDQHLLAHLRESGWPHLTPAQSMMFASLDGLRTPQAVLPERLGITRQSAHELVGGLRRLGLLDVETDTGDPRRRVVVVTAAGRRLLATAARFLDELEEELAKSLGRRRINQLRDTLAAPWPRCGPEDGSTARRPTRRPCARARNDGADGRKAGETTGAAHVSKSPCSERGLTTG